MLYVAMTRAEERLILSGGADLARLARARARRAAGLARRRRSCRDWRERLTAEQPGRWSSAPSARGRRAPRRARARRATVEARACATAAPRRAGAAAGRRAPAPPAPAAPRRPAAAARRSGSTQLSYSALEAYARCGYRFYLRARPRAARRAAARAQRRPRPALGPPTAGTLVHALLEQLDLDRTPPHAADAHAAAADGDRRCRPHAQLAQLRRALAARRRARGCAPPRRCAASRLRLRLDAAGALSRRVDVLAREDDADAGRRTTRPTASSGADLAERAERALRRQRAVYALAALRGGRRRVEVAHCFLERPDEPVSARYAHADAAALASRLSALAGRPARAARRAVAPDPHRGLCRELPRRGRAVLAGPRS